MKSARILYILTIFLGYLSGLLVANRPRFWWQEQFHNLTLYWIVPAYLAAIWLLTQMWSRRRLSLPALFAVVGYLFAATYMGLRIVPYLWPHTPLVAEAGSRVTLRGVWIDSLTSQDDQSDIAERLLGYAPDVAIIVGSSVDVLVDHFSQDRYPFRVAVRGDGSNQVRVLSKYAVGSDALLDLGVHALPGGVIPLMIGGKKRVELGVLALTSSSSPETFEQNRISARRLSSLIRNSESSRIVAAYFDVTPFSKLSSVYPEEARVRSIRAGEGVLATLSLANYSSSSSGFDIFVSREIGRGDVTTVPIPGRARSGLFFSLTIPEEGL